MDRHNHLAAVVSPLSSRLINLKTGKNCPDETPKRCPGNDFLRPDRPQPLASKRCYGLHGNAALMYLGNDQVATGSSIWRMLTNGVDLAAG